MISIDRRLSTSRDYDGNGKIEGIKTEVKGLLGVIAADSGTVSGNPGGRKRGLDHSDTLMNRWRSPTGP